MQSWFLTFQRATEQLWEDAVRRELYENTSQKLFSYFSYWTRNQQVTKNRDLSEYPLKKKYSGNKVK